MGGELGDGAWWVCRDGRGTERIEKGVSHQQVCHAVVELAQALGPSGEVVRRQAERAESLHVAARETEGAEGITLSPEQDTGWADWGDQPLTQLWKTTKFCILCLLVSPALG